MRVTLILFCFSFSIIQALAKDTYVRGHTRSDGTYVEGYHRSSPDRTRDNNYSTQGNTNPYTGKQSTRPRDGLGK